MTRGLIFGTVAVVVFVLCWLGITIVYEAEIGFEFTGEVSIPLVLQYSLLLLSVVIPTIIVAVSRVTSLGRGGVVGGIATLTCLLAVAWFVFVCVVMHLIGNGVDVPKGLIDVMEDLSLWYPLVVGVLAGLMLTTWVFGHRRNLVCLAIPAIGGALVGVAYWKLHDELSSRAGPLADVIMVSDDPWNFVWMALALAAVGVATAWLAVGLDKLLSQQ